jgi:hypothetical protein
MREWIWGVANQRVHGTTHEQVMVRWDVEQFSLQSLAGQPPIRTWMASCAKWRGTRMWTGKAAGIRCPGSMRAKKCGYRKIAGEVDIRTGRERIAMHGKAQRKHSVLTFPPHHQGIPLGARRAEGNS